MRIGQNGLELIKSFEGLELEAYQDIVGIWTIGYGHTDAAGPPEVVPGMTVTEQEAEDILRRDLGQYEDGVTRAVKVDITQNMFDALVSITFNIGVGGMKNSTFIKRLNQKDYEGCAEAMLWWNKAGGQVVRGLARRREAEADLFMRGYSGPDEIDSGTGAAVRGETIQENTPRRGNLAQSRTMSGSAVAGTAGAAGAGAVLLGDEEEADTTTAPESTPAETPQPGASPETPTPAEPEVELTESTEAEKIPAIQSALKGDDLQDAIIVTAGVIVLLAAAYVMFARVDDWRNFKR